jgi:hypothetical protein
MNIIDAYRRTGSYRAAAAICGVNLWGSNTLIGRVAGCSTWLIFRTHRLAAETHRCPPRRCGARRNTTP